MRAGKEEKAEHTEEMVRRDSPRHRGAVAHGSAEAGHRDHPDHNHYGIRSERDDGPGTVGTVVDRYGRSRGSDGMDKHEEVTDMKYNIGHFFMAFGVICLVIGLLGLVGVL